MPIDRTRYTPLGGTARRYFDNQTGNTVSRHEAEIKPRLKELGWDSAHQRAYFRGKGEYDRFRQESKLIGWSEETLERKYLAALKEGRMIENMDRISKGLPPIKQLRMNKAPNGLFAKFLADLGFRDPEATYSVGETPPKRK